jgi:hypothetical protein
MIVEGDKMAYSHTQRRKKIRRFKEKFGNKWYARFVEHVDRIVRERLGPPIGTLEEIVNASRQRGIGMFELKEKR